jgi:hypothetical protein
LPPIVTATAPATATSRSPRSLPGSKFRSFGEPAFSNAGSVSFVATLLAGAGSVTSANDTALLSQNAAADGGTALGIAWREGMAAPGPAGARFTKLNWFFPNGDGFILSAHATNGRASGNGVWRASFTDGVPVFTLLIMERLLFLTDQALKTPRTIALPTSVPKFGGTARAIAADGTVTLYVRFTDGSSEVLQFTIPAP